MLSIPNPMSHRRWQRLLAESAGSDLSPRDSAALDRHLATCERCTLDLEAQTLVRDVLADLPEEPAPRPFQITAEMLDAHSEVAPLPRPAPRPGALQWAGGAVAGVAALVAVSLVAVDATNDGGGDNVAARPVAGEALSTATAAGAADTGVAGEDGGVPEGGDGAADVTDEQAAAEAPPAPSGDRVAGDDDADASEELFAYAEELPGESESWFNGLRIAAIALGAVAVAGAGVAFTARRPR